MDYQAFRKTANKSSAFQNISLSELIQLQIFHLNKIKIKPQKSEQPKYKKPLKKTIYIIKIKTNIRKILKIHKLTQKLK